jgi:hypothetical protein
MEIFGMKRPVWGVDLGAAMDAKKNKTSLALWYDPASSEQGSADRGEKKS